MYISIDEWHRQPLVTYSNGMTRRNFFEEPNRDTFTSSWRVTDAVKFSWITASWYKILPLRRLFCHSHSDSLARSLYFQGDVVTIRSRFTYTPLWAVVDGCTILFFNKDYHLEIVCRAWLLGQLSWWVTIVLPATMSPVLTIPMTFLMMADIQFMWGRRCVARPQANLVFYS